MLVRARTKYKTVTILFYTHKIRKLRKRFVKDPIYNIQYWILKNIIQDDVIEDFAQDNELLYDYYNEPRDY